MLRWHVAIVWPGLDFFSVALLHAFKDTPIDGEAVTCAFCGKKNRIGGCFNPKFKNLNSHKNLT